MGVCIGDMQICYPYLQGRWFEGKFECAPVCICSEGDLVAEILPPSTADLVREVLGLS